MQIEGSVKLQGEIEPCVLAGLLQYLTARSSSVGYLAVTALNRRTGRIWIKEGTLHAADFDALRGQEAVRELLRLSRGQFAFVETAEAPEREIFDDTVGLLMACMQQIDESGGIATEAEPPDTCAAPEPPQAIVSPVLNERLPATETASPAPSIPMLTVQPLEAPHGQPPPLRAMPMQLAAPSAPPDAPPAPVTLPQPVPTELPAKPSATPVRAGPRLQTQAPPAAAPAAVLTSKGHQQQPQQRKRRPAIVIVTLATVAVLAVIAGVVYLAGGVAGRPPEAQSTSQVSTPSATADITNVGSGTAASAAMPAAARAVVWPELRLSGVLAANGEAASAIVNGHVVVLGDTIAGAHVDTIRPDGVVCSFGGETRLLTMTPPTPKQ